MPGGGSGMSTPRVMRPGPESRQASELDPGSAPGLPAPALPQAPRPALPSGPVRSQALLLLTCYVGFSALTAVRLCDTQMPLYRSVMTPAPEVCPFPSGAHPAPPPPHGVSTVSSHLHLQVPYPFSEPQFSVNWGEGISSLTMSAKCFPHLPHFRSSGPVEGHLLGLICDQKMIPTGPEI